MADMTKEQEASLNQSAIQFLGGHGRNFMRSMNPRNKEPLEQVQPWGESRAAALTAGKVPVIQPGATKTAPAAAAPVSGQATSANAPSVGAQVAANLLAGNNSQQTVPANDVQMAPKQVPIQALQPYGVKRKPESPPVVAGPDGFTVTPDESVYGGHIRSFGTPGTDGSGYGYTSGPARPQQSRENFLADVARQNLRGRGQVGGLSFEGSGADFAKFAQLPERNVRAQQSQQPGPDGRPVLLGPESGMGLKARLAKYKADIDLYNAASGLKALQPGAALDQQAKQLEIQSLQQRREIENRLNATTDPNERRALQGQLLAMQGKDPAQKYQVVTREGFDPVTNMPTKTPYAVNQDDPTQSFEIRGQGGQQQQFAPMPREKKLLVQGQAYDTPRGPATWNGSMFIPLRQPPQT